MLQVSAELAERRTREEEEREDMRRTREEEREDWRRTREEEEREDKRRTREEEEREDKRRTREKEREDGPVSGSGERNQTIRFFHLLYCSLNTHTHSQVTPSTLNDITVRK
uniref:luc7-like protein 3 isoform X1 n=1 Tax=Semicossyphus pulcher TaxID=241346 RepID=UPI0037E72AAA